MSAVEKRKRDDDTSDPNPAPKKTRHLSPSSKEEEDNTSAKESSHPLESDESATGKPDAPVEDWPLLNNATALKTFQAFYKSKLEYSTVRHYSSNLTKVHTVTGIPLVYICNEHFIAAWLTPDFRKEKQLSQDTQSSLRKLALMLSSEEPAIYPNNIVPLFKNCPELRPDGLEEEPKTNEEAVDIAMAARFGPDAVESRPSSAPTIAAKDENVEELLLAKFLEYDMTKVTRRTAQHYTAQLRSLAQICSEYTLLELATDDFMKNHLDNVIKENNLHHNSKTALRHFRTMINEIGTKHAPVRPKAEAVSLKGDNGKLLDEFDKHLKRTLSESARRDYVRKLNLLVSQFPGRSLTEMTEEVFLNKYLRDDHLPRLGQTRTVRTALRKLREFLAFKAGLIHEDHLYKSKSRKPGLEERKRKAKARRKASEELSAQQLLLQPGTPSILASSPRYTQHHPRWPPPQSSSSCKRPVRSSPRRGGGGGELTDEKTQTLLMTDLLHGMGEMMGYLNGIVHGMGAMNDKIAELVNNQRAAMGAARVSVELTRVAEQMKHPQRVIVVRQAQPSRPQVLVPVGKPPVVASPKPAYLSPKQFERRGASNPVIAPVAPPPETAPVPSVPPTAAEEEKEKEM